MGRLEPRSNRGFIAFNGFALGFLRTEAEFAHQFTNMIRVEVNACDALADIRDALSCPAIHGEPPVQRPELHGVEQLLLILSADALPGSRVGFSSQGCATTSKPSSVPFADGCAADLEFESDPFLVEFIRCEEFSALEAAFFELRFGQSSWFPCHGGTILEFITLKMPTSVIAPICCDALAATPRFGLSLAAARDRADRRLGERPCRSSVAARAAGLAW